MDKDIRNTLAAVIGLSLVLLCVGVTALYLWKQPAPKKIPVPQFVKIGEVGTVSGNREVKATIELEVASQKVAAAVSQSMPRIKAAILSEFSKMSFKQMATERGKSLLEDRIISRLDDFLGEGAVLEVLFTSFVIRDA